MYFELISTNFSWPLWGAKSNYLNECNNSQYIHGEICNLLGRIISTVSFKNKGFHGKLLNYYCLSLC